MLSAGKAAAPDLCCTFGAAPLTAPFAIQSGCKLLDRKRSRAPSKLHRPPQDWSNRDGDDPHERCHQDKALPDNGEHPPVGRFIAPRLFSRRNASFSVRGVVGAKSGAGRKAACSTSIRDALLAGEWIVRIVYHFVLSLRRIAIRTGPHGDPQTGA